MERLSASFGSCCGDFLILLDGVFQHRLVHFALIGIADAPAVDPRQNLARIVVGRIGLQQIVRLLHGFFKLPGLHIEFGQFFGDIGC